MAHQLRFLIAVAVLIAIGSLGCMKRIVVDGHDVDEDLYNTAVNSLLTSAAYELNCPKERLKTTILAVEPHWATATKMGVDGCGHRLVYIRPAYSTTWILNSLDRTVATPPPNSP